MYPRTKVRQKNNIVSQNDRLSPIDLHRIMDGISAEKKLKLIPARHWAYNATIPGVLYDRDGALEAKTDEAVGLIYRNVGYALHSNAQKSPWEYVDKAIRNVNRKVGKDIIAPRSVMAIMRALEEERVETRQRDEYCELGKNGLPLRHQGYRKDSWREDLNKIAATMPIGTMNEEIGIPDYWLRTAVAAKAVASEGIQSKDLPQDLPWDNDLCTEIRELKNKATIDEMMHSLSIIMPKIVAARVDHEQPESKQNKQDKQEQQQQSAGGPSNVPPQKQDQGNNETQGTPSGQPEGNEPGSSPSSQEQVQKGTPEGGGPQDPWQLEPKENSNSKSSGQDGTQENGSGNSQENKEQQEQGGSESGQSNENNGESKNGKRDIAPDLLGKMQDEAKKTSTKNDGDELDFLGGAGDEIDQSSEKGLQDAMQPGGFEGGNDDDKTERYEERIVPAWPAVMSTATMITGQIRKAIQRHFLENEIGEKEHNLRKGRLDMKSVIRGKMSKDDRDDVYTKRVIKDEREYDVYLLIDVSGSMSADVDGAACDPSVFGLYQENARWMLAGRFGVALAEELTKHKVRIGMGVHDHAFMHLKDFREKLTPDLKNYIMEQIGAFGGTDASHAYVEIAKHFAKERKSKKMLLHLTDGAFYGNDVHSAFNQLAKQDIDMVVLTVGIDASWARQHVPEDHADEINDAKIGEVLNRHFKRMVA